MGTRKKMGNETVTWEISVFGIVVVVVVVI